MATQNSGLDIKFIGEMLNKKDVINHLVEFDFGDVSTVYTADDVMYVKGGVAIALSTVVVAQEVKEIKAGKWSDKKSVTDAIDKIITDYAYASSIATRLMDLALEIQADMSTEINSQNVALQELHKLSLELGNTLRLTRIGWDSQTVTCENVLEPINEIAKKIGQVIPDTAKQ